MIGDMHLPTILYNHCRHCARAKQYLLLLSNALNGIDGNVSHILLLRRSDDHERRHTAVGRAAAAVVAGRSTVLLANQQQQPPINCRGGGGGVWQSFVVAKARAVMVDRPTGG